MRLQKPAMLLLLLLCTGPLALADEASKAAKIQEYFKLSRMANLSTQMMKMSSDQVNASMMQQMLGVTLNSEQQRQVDQLGDKVKQIVAGALSWDHLSPEYTRIYSEAFTEQQLDDMIAFYKTPTGQALVEKTPSLVQQSSAVARDRMAAVAPQIQAAIREFMVQASSGAAAPAKP